MLERGLNVAADLLEIVLLCYDVSGVKLCDFLKALCRIPVLWVVTFVSSFLQPGWVAAFVSTQIRSNGDGIVAPLENSRALLEKKIYN
jgi:hypothetical protein